ncbi:DNA alkylation repair protein [Clostridium thermobutyricum]|uniref:DNA alkylation repair protein n=1 Tax=Clostridium thermobutyricum TaxID=29372 RepID=UPI003F51CB5A
MRTKIKQMHEELNTFPTSKAVYTMASKLYKELPKSDDEFIELCDELVQSHDWTLYEMMTVWIKKRKTAYLTKYFKTYEKWLYEYTNNFGACDQLCYRVLNPIIERYPTLFEEVRKWSKSDNPYVKRASAICLMKSTKSFVVNVPFSYVKEISDELLEDNHIYVQKGVGWLLKYSYLSYPDEVVNYIKSNVNRMSRITFMYALEKMPHELKEEIIKSR